MSDDETVSRETDPEPAEPAAPPAAPVSRETDPDPEPEPEPEPDGDTFPRAYVERVRSESRRYRERAQTAEQRAGELAAALWRTRVAATDRLADPDDLPLPEDGDPLDDDGLAAAVDALLERKPHLAARRARGDVGQHERRAADDSVSLAGLLRANA